MKTRTCAKINLGLNIVNKRADGYHNLETVFYPIPLYDEIEIVENPHSPERCTLDISGMSIEGDSKKNLVVRAYDSLAGRFPLPNVLIRLKKNIPMQAGLGGGSADGAYTLRLLNEMFRLHLSVEELQVQAASLGADCAFFITSQPSYAEGIGDILQPVNLDLRHYHIVIVKPDIAISTKEAFAGIHVVQPEKCCKEIIAQPIGTWKDALKNDFETTLFPKYPQIAEIKRKLYEAGATYAAMSGSGSALFGIFSQKPSDIESRFENCFTALL